MTVFSILGFVERLREIDHDMKEAEHAIVAKACEMVATEAKRVLGTDGYNWPALSEHTKKTQPGMLLETGAMRDSIEWNAHGEKIQTVAQNTSRRTVTRDFWRNLPHLDASKVGASNLDRLG